MRVATLTALGLVAGCMEYEQQSFNDVYGTTEEGGGGGGGADGPPGEDELPPGWELDGFDVSGSSTIDVIVYGDTSSSMTEELVTMGQQVRPFVDRLAENIDDWQLAAVTGDTGCAVNGILRESTPDFEDLFAEAIVTPPVMGAIDIDEMGLQNAAIAVEESAPGGCNEGLVRGGLLYVVFISDENDESPGFDQDAAYWQQYWDRIRLAHGDSQMITLSAVAGPTPDGCEGADPGFGYDEAVSATGGEFLSLCGNWPDQIEILADAGTIKDTFVLSEVPDPNSIQVWIDAEPILPPGRWHYDAGKNAVVFDADPPMPGQRLDILYAQANP